MIPDFAIRRLGTPRRTSPLGLSTISGDQIANFVPDEAAILFNDRADTPPTGQGRIELAGPRERIFFDPAETRAAIVTCGGLCPGLNDVVRALVMVLSHAYGVRNILGIRYGYWGMVPQRIDDSVRLTPEVVENIHHRGGTFLGSSRGPQDVARMIESLISRRVTLLFAVGGDGTQRGALALSAEARARDYPLAVVGVPKTIDNDLAYTERTFGYDTACGVARDVLFAAEAEAKSALGGVSIVKLMGRESGFIAARAALASGEANVVLIPEIPFDLEGPRGFLTALEERIRSRLHALIVVAEGAGQEHLRAPDAAPDRDASGNVKLADIGTFLRDRVRTHLAARGVPVTVRYMDPGYMIRATTANASDHVFCTTLAQNAVHAAMSGRTELVVGLWHGSFVHIPIATAVSFRKRIDPDGVEWLAVIQSTGQPALMRA